MRFGHIQRKNHFKFRDTGASADAPVSHFHRRGRNGKQQLSVFLFSLVARAAAAAFGCSKSTVHKDVSVRLVRVSPGLSAQVRAVLARNKAERHLRGGAATRRKYRK